MPIADVLTTREALRRAVLDDIITRAELVAVTMDSGPLDGLQVISIGHLRDQVSGALMVELPSPSAHHAEVRTPAKIVVSALCPECGLPVEIVVYLSPSLSVDNDGAELSVKAKSKARVHVHGQLSLSAEVDGQLGLDDVVIDDLRLRILRAIHDIFAPRVEADGVLAQSPTLDEIAVALELANESDRGDLEDSLYGYAEGDDPLVLLISTSGEPVRYAITDAGHALVDETAAQPSVEQADSEGEPG